MCRVGACEQSCRFRRTFFVQSECNETRRDTDDTTACDCPVLTKSEVHPAPGEAILGWTAETITGVVGGDTWLVRVPAAAIAPMVGDLHAGIHRRIPAGNDTLRLLRSYARTLLECATSPALQRLAAAQVSDLIALLAAPPARPPRWRRPRRTRGAAPRNQAGHRRQP